MIDLRALSAPLVLDGGLSTALEGQGVDLQGVLWTGRLLREDPGLVAQAHRAYFAAGADVATTASYQMSAQGLLAAGADPDLAHDLLTRSVALARQVRAEFLHDRPGLLVAASVGPYGAHLGDGSEYRGRYGVPASRLRDYHAPRLESLAAAGPDLLAVETVPDLEEAEVLLDLLVDTGVPAWFSYTVRGSATAAGQPLAEAYDVLAGSPVLLAAGVNCSAPQDVLGAVRAAVSATGLPAVAYPNGGGTWDSATTRWHDAGSWGLDLVHEWVQAGVRLLGGCCGTGPQDVADLVRRLGSDRP